MVCSHSLQLWKWIKCTEQFKSHTCWLKWLSIPNWLCEHSQTQSFLPRYKLVSSCLSVCLSHNQTHQQKDMLKAEYRGCSASHALWKAQKHYSLSKAWVDTVVYSYWDLQRNKRSNFTRPPLETTIIIFPVIMSKVLAMSMSWCLYWFVLTVNVQLFLQVRILLIVVIWIYIWFMVAGTPMLNSSLNYINSSLHDLKIWRSNVSLFVVCNVLGRVNV